MGIVHEQKKAIKAATIRVATNDGKPAFGVYSGPPSTGSPNETTPRHLLIPASLLPSPDAQTIAVEANGKQYTAKVIAADPSGQIVHCHATGIEGIQLIEHGSYDAATIGGKIENFPVAIPPAEQQATWPIVTASTLDADDLAVIHIDAPHELPIGSPIVTNTGRQLFAIVIGTKEIEGKSVTLAILPTHTKLLDAQPQVPPGTKGPSLTYTDDIFVKQHAEREAAGYGPVDPNFKPPTTHIQDAGGKEVGRDGKRVPRHFSGSKGS